MKRIIKYVSICLLSAMIPFAVFVVAGECVKNNYENVFTAALIDKYDRLLSIDEQKIVFVGGSSLPFGLRSDVIERELEIKVVDFGVYAALGTKAMMEISLANLKSGDVVILAPEINKQTYSLYTNADAMWEAANGKREIMDLLDFSEKIDLNYNYFDFLFDKISISGEEGVKEGELYSRKSFNEYGDVNYERKSNIMAGGYDKSQPVTLDILNDEFLEYVNRYVDLLKKRSVDVFFAFSPVNALSVGYTASERAAFEKKLTVDLHCPLLGSVEDFTYDAQYFYNTNYHLNDRGALLNTKNYIDLIKREYGISTPTNVEIPPADDEDDVFYGEDENEKFFIAESVGGVTYLTGVKEEYRDSTELTLPKGVGGKKVSAIAAGCFEGCSALKKLTVPENYKMFDVGIFEGCDSLNAIYLLTESPGDTSIPKEGLFDGAAPDLKVYVKTSAYTAFLSSYTWRNYDGFLAKDE